MQNILNSQQNPSHLLTLFADGRRCFVHQGCITLIFLVGRIIAIFHALSLTPLDTLAILLLALLASLRIKMEIGNVGVYDIGN